MKLQRWLFVLSMSVSAGVATPVYAESGHEHGEEQAPRHDAQQHDHGEEVEAGTDGSLAERWYALSHTRDAIAGDLEQGRLEAIHEKAEKLPALANSLLEDPTSVDPAKLARLQGAVKQIPKVADALHEAADRGDEAGTGRELKRLDGLLQLIRAQYPEGVLEPHEHSPGAGDSSMPGHAQAEVHYHAMRPIGEVLESAQEVVHLRALEMKFQPQTFEVRTGIPTLIELQNVGSTEHSLIVKIPGGGDDWIHLHAKPGASDAAVYRLDYPGRYPVLCTIPGHTEAGMVGVLVVKTDLNAHGGAHHDGHE